MGDQVGDLGLLEVQAAALLLAGRGAGTLVPAESPAFGHQQASPSEGPVPELGVLRAPLGERLVEPSHRLEEAPADAEVPGGDHPEDVIRGGGKFVGAGHVELDPLRPLSRTIREQVLQGAWSVPHRLRVDAVGRHVGPEPERQCVGHGLVPAGVRRQPARLRHHVAIEEHQDIVRSGMGATVTGPGRPEAPTLLAYHRKVERRALGPAERDAGAVIHHDHLEQVTRVGLPFQSSQRESQSFGCLVVGDHYGHGKGGDELVDGRDLHLAPVVSPHRGRPGGGHDLRPPPAGIGGVIRAVPPPGPTGTDPRP